MNDGGVWVKMGNAAPAGAAVIGNGSVGVDNNPDGKPSSATNNADGSYDYVDGDKTYRVYAFTTATTTASIRLTDEARAKITDEELLMAIATTNLPDDFTGDPVKLFDRKFRNQLRNALEVAPAVDPGLTLDVDEPGFADVLVLGGGGGGGRSRAGGGGAGGLVEIVAYLSEGKANVVVGSGGYGANSGDTSGKSGVSSYVGNYFALGGGGGGSVSAAGGTGGSGGGAGGSTSSFPGGGSVSQQGNDGGSGFGFSGSGQAAGGGGGSLSKGTDAAKSKGGNGGAGSTTNISGSPISLAGGGGGGSYDGTAGLATDGGGRGRTSGNGDSGVNGQGGGGGGGGYNGSSAGSGGDGGSGIVIVRVEI